MSNRPLSPAMRRALLAMLKGPLTRGKDGDGIDGWIAQDRSVHALVTVRGLRDRGFVLPKTALAALSIAGRQAAQSIQREAA